MFTNLSKKQAAVGMAALAAAMGAASGVSAQPITAGTYRLTNHPGGDLNPPPYGMRFADLIQVTPSIDMFTMDFNHPLSLMQMQVTGSTIRVFGASWGGRDIGPAHAADIHQGLYIIDFMYNIGVASVPADDDMFVPVIGGVNFGTVTTPGGQTIPLADKSMGGYSFRLGNEDNDQGHRGGPGISGWGWMMHANDSLGSSDMLFTATPIIPSPAGAAALGLGGLVCLRRRRR